MFFGVSLSEISYEFGWLVRNHGFEKVTLLEMKTVLASGWHLDSPLQKCGFFSLNGFTVPFLTWKPSFLGYIFIFSVWRVDVLGGEGFFFCDRFLFLGQSKRDFVSLKFTNSWKFYFVVVKFRETFFQLPFLGGWASSKQRIKWIWIIISQSFLKLCQNKKLSTQRGKKWSTLEIEHNIDTKHYVFVLKKTVSPASTYGPFDVLGPSILPPFSFPKTSPSLDTDLHIATIQQHLCVFANSAVFFFAGKNMHQKIPTYLEVMRGTEGWILHREYLRRGDFLIVSGLLALFLKQNLDCMFDTWQKFQKSSPKWWFDNDFSWVKK